MKQLSKKKRSMKGKYHQYNPSQNSHFHETCYVHIDELLLKPQNEPSVSSATTNYLKILKETNKNLDFSELTKLKALTSPATPYYNNDKDNSKHDLILYTDDIIESPERSDVGKCRKNLHKYKVVESLGEGSFGQVVKCVDLETNKFVAMKVLRNKPVYMRQGMLEVTMLELMNVYFDPDCEYHTLRLYDHFIYHEHICIVNELLSVNLYELMSENNCEGLSVNISRTFLQQILESLEICYRNNIIHCDLKPENVLLVDMTKNVRLIDFGSACFENHTLYSYIQSRHYRAPEVILGIPYTSAIDMWSLGCIAAEFFLGIPIFPGSCEYNQLYKIIKMIGPPPPEFLEQSKRTSKYFKKRKVYKQSNFSVDGNNKNESNYTVVYELKSHREYEFDNRESIEPNKDYYDYVSLEDFCNRVPMKFSSRDENRKEERRRAFYDFLKRIFTWNPEERMQPSQALQHPFITKQPFTEDLVIERSVSPIRKTREKPMMMDEMIMKVFDDLTSTESMQYINENLTTNEYYKTFLKALDKGIILNIQNANPFLLPPMTPPSVISLFEQIEKEKEEMKMKERRKHLILSQPSHSLNENEFNKHYMNETNPSTLSKSSETTKIEIHNLEDPNKTNKITIQKEGAMSYDSTHFYNDNNSMSYQQSWSQTVGMKIPGVDGNENNDVEFSFENNDHNLNHFESSQQMNKNNQQKKQHGLSQMEPINE